MKNKTEIDEMVDTLIVCANENSHDVLGTGDTEVVRSESLHHQ